MWKPAFCPAFAPICTKKAIWHDLWSIQNEAISLVAMRCKKLWLVEKNRATVKPDSSLAPRWMKTYSERRIELRSLQILKKLLKKSSQFLSSEQPCEPKTLDVALKITGVEKIPSETLWLWSTQRQFDSSFEWKERKWGWRFLSSVVGDSQNSLIYIVSETHFGCETIDLGLWLGILNSLLCPEMDRNIRIGKQGYVFYFTDFKKWCFDVSFLTSISVSTVVLPPGKVEFFK